MSQKTADDSSTMKKCILTGICPGCSLWEIAYPTQLEQKKQRLVELFPMLESITTQCHTAGEFGLRQRFDFIVKNNTLGLIDKNRNFIEIKECLQLTSNLQKALHQVSQILKESSLNIGLGTLRLRESSRGQISRFGLWLDFANSDIKNLLVEKTTLQKLAEHFFIEVGQKKKCLDKTTFTNEQIKLTEPNMQPWFHTHNYKSNQSIDLNCAVSSFTQPSAISAKLITDIVIQYLNKAPENIWEFGCGIGQYTFPLLSLDHKVYVFENDIFAIDCVKKTAHECGLEKNLAIYTGDGLTTPTTVLVNPPKSGLKKFTENVINANPEKIIYVSCYPETLKTDSETFLQHNYKIKDAHIVDQFPQTKHFEVVMLFERIDS